MGFFTEVEYGSLVLVYSNGVLVDIAESINFVGATVATDGLGHVTVTITGGGGIGTVYTDEVLTDTGDHKNFTSAHAITTVIHAQNASSGKGLPSSNFSKSGTTLTLTAPDPDLASDGIALTYA